MKRASGNTNILTIDSSAQQQPAIVEPASPTHDAADMTNQRFVGGLAPAGTARSIHSYDSTTELRQRRRMPTATNPQAEEAAQRKSRYSMADNGLLHADAGGNALAEAFSNPALRAKPKCNIWVPLDNHGLCNELYNTVQRLGEDTIRIINRATRINEKAKVQADVEFDPDNSDDEDISPTKI
ncbi:hypothetical protein GGI23_004819 [Coemansia sp. RSA 2559]|nr:hypothetical protein GGI23_004819 [Coemansia sp. RSA 2559]